MKGSKYLSELITDPGMLRPGRINIIEANTSAGKTWFALNTIPEWAGSPEKVLYLIDTTNGELRLQQNILTISRQNYVLADYASGRLFGEFADDARDRMPVMTYAGFGSEIRSSGHAFWEKFEYIVCDEMQNLVRYQSYGDRTLLQLVEITLRSIAAKGRTKIIALSATSQKIRERFGVLCHDVAFDSDDLVQYETAETISYTGVEAILLQSLGQTGILYTQSVADMIKYINFARENGIRADGFWSLKPETQKKFPMTKEQDALRSMVLKQETFPDDLDLLVINDASETCIKIQAEKRKVDYMVIHYSDEEKRIQVRGRYCGDLPKLYIHGPPTESLLPVLPPQYLDVPLFSEDNAELCSALNIRTPEGRLCKWTTVKKRLQEIGFTIEETRGGNKRCAVIHPLDSS